MVANPRASTSPCSLQRVATATRRTSSLGLDDLRPLNVPQPAEVCEDKRGKPSAIRSGRHWITVSRVEDTWRIDDEWWRKQPISRIYIQAVLENSVSLVFFKNLLTGVWYQQQL